MEIVETVSQNDSSLHGKNLEQQYHHPQQMRVALEPHGHGY